MTFIILSWKYRQIAAIQSYDFVSKVQAIFCPQQPICDITGEYDSSTVLATLPASFTIGNTTIQTGHIPEVFRICCYHCACTCEVHGNCCLTKRVITNATYHANSTRNAMMSKCVESSLIGQGMISSKYYMIQKCFGETSNEPPHEKTNNLHRRKQRRRSASQ